MKEVIFSKAICAELTLGNYGAVEAKETSLSPCSNDAAFAEVGVGINTLDERVAAEQDKEIR